MSKKSFIIPLIISTGFLCLVGCNNSVSRGDKELYITVYDGGYGTDWIDQVAKDYEEKTGVKVIWTADQNILDRISTELESPASDIYMSHDITWQEFAELGLLENLDDLYESQVEGTNKKFVDRLCAGAEEVSRLEDGHYYKVCYTQGAGGLIYNIDMFNQYGWEVPTTYDELKTLCERIVTEAHETPDLETIVPIAWSGADREYYWDYIVFEWWAQLGGEAAINKYKAYLGDDGKYSTGYQVYDPATNHKEFKEAYQKWHDLIAMNPTFSNDKPQSTKLVTANALFASGKAAMIPYAQWAKYEIQKNSGINFNFNVAMMKTPKLTSTSKDYNYNVGFGDSLIVPSKIPAESKTLAKDFLRYLAGKEACKTFVDKARGAFLAFDYSIVDLGDLMQDTYIKSVYEKLTECTNFNLTSMNPVAYINSASIMPWIGNVYYYAKAFAAPSNAAYQATTVCDNIFTTAKNGWNSWLTTAHVSDQ